MELDGFTREMLDVEEERRTNLCNSMCMNSCTCTEEDLVEDISTGDFVGLLMPLAGLSTRCQEFCSELRTPDPEFKSKNKPPALWMISKVDYHSSGSLD